MLGLVVAHTLSWFDYPVQSNYFFTAAIFNIAEIITAAFLMNK